MFTEEEKNNIFMKLAIDEDDLKRRLEKNRVEIYDNAKEALFLAYDINIEKVKGDEGAKQLILSLIQLEEDQCLGLDDDLTLADAFIAFHHKTCRASDEKFVVFID